MLTPTCEHCGHFLYPHPYWTWCDEKGETYCDHALDGNHLAGD